MPPRAAEAGGESRPVQETLDSAAAFLGQLYAPVYVADLRPRAAVRPVGRATPPHAAAEPAPAVLLISRSRDGEFDAVAGLLGRVGITTVRVDAEDVAEADLLVDPARGAVRLDGHWFMPTVAWLRHFAAQAIQGGGGRAHDAFLRESWGTAAAELAGVAAARIRSHCPERLAQVRLAERHGIATPRTVLTTDPYQALRLLRGPRFIIKAAYRHFVEPTPGSLTGVFPAIVAHRELKPLPASGLPVIVQEYVEHEAELRVYYVAGQVHGFRVVKETPADIWLHGDRVLVEVVEPPPGVVRAARLLAGELSLPYCAFDFLLRDAEPVFLEMDPVGDWRWMEEKAGAAAVTMGVARMLCALHGAHSPLAAGRGPRQGSFDLLTFLAGNDGRPARGAAGSPVASGVTKRDTRPGGFVGGGTELDTA